MIYQVNDFGSLLTSYQKLHPPVQRTVVFSVFFCGKTIFLPMCILNYICCCEIKITKHWLPFQCRGIDKCAKKKIKKHHSLRFTTRKKSIFHFISKSLTRRPSYFKIKQTSLQTPFPTLYLLNNGQLCRLLVVRIFLRALYLSNITLACRKFMRCFVRILRQAAHFHMRADGPNCTNFFSSHVWGYTCKHVTVGFGFSYVYLTYYG